MPETPPLSREAVTFRFEGRALTACAGQTIAAALAQEGILALSQAPSGAARSVFCGMGVCNDCLVTVDGKSGQRACMTPVREGQVIARQPSRYDLTAQGCDLVSLPDGPLPLREADVLVVGAGPAGLACARDIARAGGTVCLADEFPHAGGQFYKQAESGQARALYAHDAQMADGAALARDARQAGATILTETLVWGGERDADGRLKIGLSGPSGASYVLARRLVVATGAYERPAPFEGWTLPGVMTTGAAQTLLRKSGVAVARRIFIGGNGPLNFQVAAELLAAGARVTGLAEAAPAPFARPAAALRLFRADPTLAGKGIALLARLRRAGVPLHWGRRIARVSELSSGAKEITLTDGSRHEADAVLLGGNFAASGELALLLGCRPRPGIVGSGIDTDADGRTSIAEIFTIGESAGFGGAHLALARGEAAARGIIGDLGLAALPRSSGGSARHDAFQQALWQLYAPAGTEEAPSDDTLICRCESVTAGRIRALVSGGVRDIPTLKRLTRASMGRCQGRYCQSQLLRLAGATGVETASPLAPQMPLRPVPLAALAVEKPEWGGHRKALLPDSQPPQDARPLPLTDTDCLVIGAGIAGLSTAMFLARDGREVAVVDRGEPNALASGGNAGSLHAQLLSFDHGAKAEGDGSAALQTLPLQRDSIALWRALQDELGTDFDARITGGLMVAETEAHLAAMERKSALERQMGIDCEVISRDDLYRLEPNLGQGFIGAAWCPQEGKINPLVATQAVRREAEAKGATILTRTAVVAIRREGTGFVVTTTRGEIRARAVVNAAGAFASRVGAMLGLDVPVFGAPLQMIVTEPVAPVVSHLLAHADRHLTLKQASNGNLLIGGGWTAGLDPVRQHPRPLLDSIEGNLWVAQHVVPALRRLKVIRTWAAMNINIDGAPILGAHPAMPGFFNVVTSNGYTLGPIVGRITAALVSGRDVPGISPFSIDRFGKA
ncbi:FAD-dependent oxidoreductase [Paenirhodobacter populi]|uniref:FAD-dependent oxidoreductase n=1 Tax=Paenirhodobacter populi TaxID=2306993 RepID=A0A443J4S3_9RHOB|nr:FAD-dependent oxidoreductase [Sinirhodobacter populi]RWR15335.1 FAD-dependent oxidoreductase [Sinirhodobacter populi]